MNRITVVLGLLSIYFRVVAINSHKVGIVRDREGEDLAAKFALAFHESEELDHSPYS